MKGLKTILYGIAIMALSAFSDQAVADFVAEHLPWVGGGLGLGVIILRAITTSSVFAGLRPGDKRLQSAWIAALLALFLLLGGCVGTSGLSEAEKAQLTPAQRVYALKGEYDILLGQVIAYARQPECSEVLAIACAEPEIVATSAVFARQADDALDTAELAVRTDDLASANYAAVARMLVARLSAYLITKEIAK